MVMNKLDLQTFLFEGDVSRMELMSYASTIEPIYRVAVYRNHSFELIENTITPYLEYAGLGVEFLYSDYDDSLSFLELDLTVDLVILWLDLSVYKLSNLNQFIESRIDYLKTCFNGNIVFAACGVDIENLKVAQYKLSKFKDLIGDKFFDLRLEPFSGTKLSHVANLEISRDLGLNYLPALLKPNLKCIVVDLDNTLYNGVLGEDGIDGVVLSEGHRQLQIKLKTLSEHGFFLCIASKNDDRDVVNLFKQRADFPLKIEDFVQIYANWESKSDSINWIAKALNISVDSFLFIDDNLGELMSVLENHPSIHIIWAKDNASITLDVVSNYPGLLKLDYKKEDGLRKKDALANQQRLAIKSSLNRDEYIRDLAMELVYDIDKLSNVDRITELANKTNQFIFSYQRYSSQEISSLVTNADSTVVTISLSDRLSDSGIIGVVVLTKQEDTGMLEECFVSCRALGRGIDQAIVLGSIKFALEALDVDKLKVAFVEGERNLPAQKFCEEHFAEFVSTSGDFKYKIPSDLITVTVNQKQSNE